MRRRSVWRYLIIFALLCVVLAGGAGVCAYYYFTYDLPQLFSIDDYKPPVVTRVYADDGSLIAEFYKERRVLVPYSRIPKRLIQAFIAAEDADFFRHPGVDISGILRAFLKNLKAGRIVQGGSTITQQITRSLLLTPEKSYGRKIKEIILSYRLEQRLTKEQILTIYLNQIYLGHGAYGVEAAANAYFDKSVSALNLAEMALLAGLPQAPSRYSPFSSRKLAAERQFYVLNRMVEEGYISAAEGQQALNTHLTFTDEQSDFFAKAPYFAEHVRRYLERKYGSDALLTDGLQVYTTVDVNSQRMAQDAMEKGLIELDKRIGYRGAMENVPKNERDAFCAKLAPSDMSVGSMVTGLVTAIDKKDRTVAVCLGSAKGVIDIKNMSWARKPDPEVASDYAHIGNPDQALGVGDVILARIIEAPNGNGVYPLALEQEPEGQSAILCMEAETGYVKVMVGGLDFRKSQFNRAVQARRQPGSAFKPIIYVAALDKGYTPVSVFIDSPVVYEIPGQDKWKPSNYEKKFFGPTLLRTALIKSRNVVTVKVLQEIGVQYAIDYARKLGFESDLVGNLSLALGSSDVTLLELVRAYSAFCEGGELVEPICVTKVVDRDGKVLEENLPRRKQVISPETAAIMTSLLQGVVNSGTGRKIKALNRPVAGKTGTTNDLKDAWFVGYTPEYITGVWVGFDDHRAMGRFETGARAAGPIWLNFMQSMLKDQPIRDFPLPEGVVFAKINPESGKLAGPEDRDAVFECFQAGTEPTTTAYAPVREEAPALDFFKTDLGASSSIH